MGSTTERAGFRHLTRSDLELREDVAGARMWAVGLDEAMLTYFEVEPGCRFERHRHRSEQITLVLEGTLVFEVDGREFEVGPGEVAAVPADLPHAVRSLDEPVVAVDAWSPPREVWR